MVDVKSQHSFAADAECDKSSVCVTQGSPRGIMCSVALGIFIIVNVCAFVYSWSYVLMLFTSLSIFIVTFYAYGGTAGSRHHTEGRPIRRVLVTGCDTGFGHGIALTLSQQNTYVFAGCLTTEGVERLQNDPSFRGSAFVMDVTKQDDIENARKLIESGSGDEGLWALVNNSGIALPGLVDWQSVAEMQRMMDVNLWGCVQVTKEMLPLIKVARGRVVNVSSMAGRVPFTTLTAYAMSKHAVEAFSDGLRYEMKPWSVSVHIVEPTFFQTDIIILAQKYKDLWNKQGEDIKRAYGEEYHEIIIDTWGKYMRENASPDIQDVVDRTCHAVTSDYPKSRYAVGNNAMLCMAIAALPTFIGDFALSLHFPLPIPAAMKPQTRKS